MPVFMARRIRWIGVCAIGVLSAVAALLRGCSATATGARGDVHTEKNVLVVQLTARQAFVLDGLTRLSMTVEGGTYGGLIDETAFRDDVLRQAFPALPQFDKTRFAVLWVYGYRVTRVTNSPGGWFDGARLTVSGIKQPGERVYVCFVPRELARTAEHLQMADH